MSYETRDEPPSRRKDWRMFTLNARGLLLQQWQEFANFDIPEVPIVGMAYWLGPDDNRKHYRVAWISVQHRHFGVYEEDW